MNITVKVKDLKAMIDDVYNDKVEYVDLTIIEMQEFEGDIVPDVLNIEGYDGEGGGMDYGSINEVKVNPFYKLD